MKKTFGILKNLVVTVYILLIIFVTICLLSYNDYKVTVFGKNTLIPIIDEDLEPDFYVGDLVIAKKGSLARVKEGDEIFFYRTISGETTINYAKVTKTERVNDTEFTYTVEGDHRFSSSYYIGNTKDATVIPVAGKLLSLLQSKWGFLFLGVFPSLVAFLYTLHNVITEVQEVKEAERKAKRKKKKKKTVEKNTGKDIVQTEENASKEKDADVSYVSEENDEIDGIQVDTEMDSVENDDVVEKVEDNGFSKIETTISIERNEKVEEQHQKEDASKNEIKENKEETVKEEKEVKIEEPKEKQSAEEKKKALIEAKMKSMTEEEKRALIEAKLKSMTPEEKKALIEAKKKKMEAEKNKKGE